ncbi:MAG TPA: hypothetical protein VGU68_07545, partial [Ktedonobacteraceae bacterium]|nr:hypothetical protein [Ktedonobacteraceae bacterium]
MTLVTLDGADDVFADVAGLDVAADVFADAAGLDVAADEVAGVVGLALPVGVVPPPEQEIIPGKIKKVKTNRAIS